METEQKLNKMNLKLESKKSELLACHDELESIIAQIVDSKAGEREKHVSRRFELINLRGLLQDEVDELQNRRNALFAQMYQERLNNEEAELDKLATIATDKKAEMDKVINDHLHFINSPSRSGETKETARQKVELETAKAKAMAESRIARQDAERQKAKVRQAKEDLETALQSI